MLSSFGSFGSSFGSFGSSLGDTMPGSRKWKLFGRLIATSSQSNSNTRVADESVPPSLAAVSATPHVDSAAASQSAGSVRRSSSMDSPQLRFRDDTANSNPNETRAQTLERAKAEALAEANREGESGPARDERIRRALFLAELKLKNAEESAAAMQKAEEAMLMKVLDERSRNEVERLNSRQTVMVYLPVREFTVTDGLQVSCVIRTHALC